MMIKMTRSAALLATLLVAACTICVAQPRHPDGGIVGAAVNDGDAENGELAHGHEPHLLPVPPPPPAPHAPPAAHAPPVAHCPLLPPPQSSASCELPTLACSVASESTSSGGEAVAAPPCAPPADPAGSASASGASAAAVAVWRGRLAAGVAAAGAHAPAGAGEGDAEGGHQVTVLASSGGDVDAVSHTGVAAALTAAAVAVAAGGPGAPALCVVGLAAGGAGGPGEAAAAPSLAGAAAPRPWPRSALPISHSLVLEMRGRPQRVSNELAGASAAAVPDLMSPDDMERLMKGEIDIVFLSPERLAMPEAVAADGVVIGDEAAVPAPPAPQSPSPTPSLTHTLASEARHINLVALAAIAASMSVGSAVGR